MPDGLMQKQQAETTGFVARTNGGGVGAAAVGMLPGGGFAAMATQQAKMAQQQAFAAETDPGGGAGTRADQSGTDRDDDGDGLKACGTIRDSRG